MKIKNIYFLTINIFLTCGMFIAVAAASMYIAGYRFYVIQSGSMEPCIPVGSLAVVSVKYPYEKLNSGDVICYESPLGKSVTHRVVSVSEEGLVTKGDENEISDGILTTQENYIGCLTVSLPHLGFVIDYFSTMRGRILMFFLLLCLLLAEAVSAFFDVGNIER